MVAMLTTTVFAQKLPSGQSLRVLPINSSRPSILGAKTTQASSSNKKNNASSQTMTNSRSFPNTSNAAGTVSNQAADSSFQVNEQFSGSSLDANLWEVMNLPKGYRNNEEQEYTSAQVKVNNGNLQITAKRTDNGKWYSGEVHSKWQFTYGEFEVRLALSTTGQGVWPAAWLMGRTDSWPANGEIDIFENVNGTPTIYGTIHGSGSHGNWAIQKTYSPVDVTQYHTYKVVKKPGSMSWWIDGVQRGEWHQSQTPPGGIWPFESHQNFGLLNLAIGGDWPGPSDASTPGTIIMNVDYFTVKNGSN